MKQKREVTKFYTKKGYRDKSGTGNNFIKL